MAGDIVKKIRKATRRKFTAEEKIKFYLGQFKSVEWKPDLKEIKGGWAKAVNVP